MDTACAPLHSPCTSGLPCPGLAGEGAVAAAAQRLLGEAAPLLSRCRTARWLWSVWQQDELLSNGRKVEAASFTSFFLSWYRLISHRILPRALQVLNIPVSLEEQLECIVNCFLMPEPWFPAVKTCKQSHWSRLMACLVRHSVSSSGSWQTLPRKSLYTFNVLNCAVLSCGGQIPAGQQLLVCSRRSAVPWLLPSLA